LFLIAKANAADRLRPVVSASISSILRRSAMKARCCDALAYGHEGAAERKDVS
jgi:hypothetical protein